MSDTVGRIDLILDVDGKGLPGKVRRAGEKAGSEAGEGFNDNFNDEITKGAKERNKKIGEEGRKAGESYSDARDRILQRRNKGLSDRLAKAFETPKGLSDYINKFDTAQDAITKMREELKELRKQNLISDEDFKRNNATLTQNRRALIRAKDAANAMATAQERVNRDWDEAIKHNKAFDRAILTNQRNIQKWRKEIEGNLNRSLNELAKKQRQVAKDSAAWAKALERANVAAGRTRASMDRLRVSVGNTFRDGDKGIDRYVNKFPTVREGVTRLKDDLVRLREQNIITNREFTNSVTHLTRYTRNTLDLDSGLQRVTKSLGSANANIKQFNGNARQTPYILKTILGYTALFTALAPAIAVLGSATGSGALALSTGVGALALAVVTLIPAFKGMLDDVEKLPAKARPAAQALQDMAGPLSDLQDTIQEGVFDGLGPEINKLTRRIFPRLEKGFGKTAKTINGLFRDLIDGLTSKSALGRMDRIFSGLQPILKSLGRAVLNLGGAFAKLFEAALPSGTKFFDFLNDSLGEFNAWLSSDSGRRALTTFFEHLDEIMPSVGRLIGAAGKAVAGLVTDKAVDNMTRFLDTMSGALPGIVGTLGTLVDHLDPLGLAADALSGLSDFLDNHKSDFAALGEGVNEFIKSGAELVGPILGGIADQILRVGPGIFQQLSDGLKAINTPELQAAVKDTLPKLGDVLDAAGKAVGSLLKAIGDSGLISDAITQIGNAAAIATPFLDGLSIALDVLTGKWQSAADTLDGIDFSKFFEGFAGFKTMSDPVFAIFDALYERIFGVGLVDSFKQLGGFIDDWVSDFAKTFPAAMTLLFNTLGTYVSNLPSLIGTLFKALFGFGGKGKGKSDDSAKKAGEKGVDDASKAAGAKVLGVASIGAKLMEKLFGGIKDFDFGALLAAPFRGIGDKIAGFFTGLPEKLGGIFNQLPGKGKAGADGVKKPFEGVPGGITGLLNPVPTLIGGIMGLVSGKKGADNTKTPFSGVLGAIKNFVSGVPGAVNSKVAESSGKKGASNTSNPFAPLLGVISGMVAQIPGRVSAKVAEASGQQGARNTSEPFSGVKGKIQGYISGVAGIVSGALSGVSGQGAADRIVSAFQSVKDRVRSALSGLSGVVNTAIAGAQGAVAGGVAKIKATARAAGTVTSGPEFALIGEAGPEAVVPLNRPLSQVDPSVRALSAIAQGKFPAASAAGGTGKQITIAEGAIIVQAPNSDSEQVASAVLDRMVAKL